MTSVLAGIALAALLAQAPSATDPTAAAEAKAAQGDLAGAAADYRALLDGVSAPRAVVLYRLANLERRLGNDTAAVARALEAASLLQRDGDRGRASEALNLAAMAEFTRANYVASARHLDEAIRLSGQGADWERHAEQLGNLGSVYFFVGRYDDAARVNARALTVTDQHRGAPWAARRRMVVTANQAALHQRLGRYADALALYGTVRSSGAPLPSGEHGQVMVNEGALFRRLGDPYKALQAYDRAGADFAQARDAKGEVTVLTNRGIALALDLGRADDALASFTEAARAASAAHVPREELLARLYRGETLLRSGRADAARADFEAALGAAVALDTREEQWKALYGLGRVDLAAGREPQARKAFDRAIGIVDVLREGLAVPSSRAEFFQDKREVYDARIAQGLGTDTPATVFELIERSRARAWRDRLKLEAVTLAGVQARLSPGTVLLAYWWSPQRAAVVRVTRAEATVTPLTVGLGLVTAFADAMRRPGDPRWTAFATELGDALLPDALVSGAAHVVVVPDGALGAVPFEALTVDGAALVARAAVSYLPAAALLRASALSASGWRPPWRHHLVAFGDPLSGDDPWSTPGTGQRRAASATEVRDISAALGGRHEIYLGRDNRKAALTEALQDPPAVLHLATHGAADLVAGERSRLVFSPAFDGGPSESLFLREVYELPLGGVDLAVLSACETERGPDVRGEGVQGFSRAVLAAGAARVVTTLWRVPDAASAELMRVFYYHLQRGERADDALAKAKRALITSETLAHPHYWAAFVLTGGTDALPRALRWREVGGAALMVGGALALGLLAWRRRATAVPLATAGRPE